MQCLNDDVKLGPVRNVRMKMLSKGPGCNVQMMMLSEGLGAMS